ncbi:MAG: hypothetical protein SFW64_07720 [Alphaproteobacteria bacterium]|nr:hypothetical protein [Alphaproteobacteria bacterium]
MPWLFNLFGVALLMLGVLFAVWISFWVLLAVFALAVVLVIWSHLRAFLVAKGILSPRFDAPPDGEEGGEDAPTITIIEGDYTRVDDRRE